MANLWNVVGLAFNEGLNAKGSGVSEQVQRMRRLCIVPISYRSGRTNEAVGQLVKMTGQSQSCGSHQNSNSVGQ